MAAVAKAERTTQHKKSEPRNQTRGENWEVYGERTLGGCTNKSRSNADTLTKADIKIDQTMRGYAAPSLVAAAADDGDEYDDDDSAAAADAAWKPF